MQRIKDVVPYKIDNVMRFRCQPASTFVQNDGYNFGVITTRDNFS